VTPSTPSLDDLRIDRDDGVNNRRRWPWIVLLCLLLLAGGGWWWWTGPAQLVEVRVATAQETTVAAEDTAVLNASGYVAARRRARTISSWAYQPSASIACRTSALSGKVGMS
jgi:hypothetical protein